jgi:hypothetical protein
MGVIAEVIKARVANDPRIRLCRLLTTHAEMDEAQWSEADVRMLHNAIMDIFRDYPVEAETWYAEWRSHGTKSMAPKGSITPDSGSTASLLRERTTSSLPDRDPDQQRVVDIRAEEQLYRLWWKTLPDKVLARLHGGHLDHWQRERQLSTAAINEFRARIRDLLDGADHR